MNTAGSSNHSRAANQPPSGGDANLKNALGSSKADEVLNEIESAKQLMADNVSKLGSNLVELKVVEDQTQNVVRASQDYKLSGKALRRQKLLRDLQTVVAWIIVIILVLAIVIVPLVVQILRGQ